MAIKSAQVSVLNTAATKLEDEGGKLAGETVFIRNTDATNSVFLGNSSVDSTHGFELKAGITIGPIKLDEGDDPIYARAAAGTVRVDVFAS